jgi:O-antigen/teichoic acid export membrane protein
MFSLQDVGIYSVAFRVASLAALYQVSFGLAWFPYAMSVMTRPDNRERYAVGFAGYVTAGSALVLGMSLFAPEIVRLVGGPSYAAAIQQVGPLCLAGIAEGMVIPGSLGIMIEKRTYFYSLGYALGLASNVLAMLLLMPDFGVLSVGVGLAVGRLVHAGFVYRVSQRLYPIRHHRNLLACGLGLSILAVLCAGFLGAVPLVWRASIFFGAGGALWLLSRPLWPELRALGAERFRSP